MSDPTLSGDRYTDITRHADDARDAIRALAALTRDRVMAGHEAFAAATNVESMSALLTDALENIARALSRATEDPRIQIREDDGGEVDERITSTLCHLLNASVFARAMGDELRLASRALEHQRVRYVL